MSNSCNPWTVACQAPLSMEFSRQETGVGCRFQVSCIAGRFFTDSYVGRPYQAMVVFTSSQFCTSQEGPCCGIQECNG